MSTITPNDGLFGVSTDHFDLTSNALSGKAVMTAASKTPVAQDRSDAEDANGDIVGSAYFGNSAGFLYEISNTYQIKSGEEVHLNALKLGVLSSGTEEGIVASDITVNTANGGELPTIEVSGIEGNDPIESDVEKTFTLPDIEIIGAMRAQEMVFTTGDEDPAGCRLTSSSFTATIDIADASDGDGEIVAHGISGGTIEISADFVGITEPPAWSFPTPSDFTVTQDPGEEEPQADWETGSGTAAGILERDVSA